METINETKKRAYLAKALLVRIVGEASQTPNPPLFFDSAEGKGVIRIDTVYFENDRNKADLDKLLRIIDGITMRYYNELITIELTIEKR